jgi:DNA invertase Pin-like site-specific DNA recombinase
MKSRAAIYLRVSSDKQTIENQRPEVEQLARARGYTLAAVYEEQASAARHRPEYEAMLKDAKKGPSRFSSCGPSTDSADRWWATSRTCSNLTASACR